MANETGSQAAEDWRLEGELDLEHSGRLHELVGRFRGPDPVDDIKTAVGEHVVVTHDGKKLFAYAATQEELAAARTVIEQVLARDGIGASLRVSTWDGELDRWRQVDPPPDGAEQASEQRDRQDGAVIEKRTLIASSGKLVRKEFEQTMAMAAEQLGLQCQTVEHPHLLTTQVAFTVTGPRHKIDQFASDLNAEGFAIVRGDLGQIFSPL